MKKRVFVAINLPEDFKKMLVKFQKKWADLPFRWVKSDNLHLTLVFVGWINDDSLFKICKLLKDAVKNFKSLEINFERICYGPPGKLPRLIWVEGSSGQELAILKDSLERILFESGVGFDQEHRVFRPHITLGRLKNEADNHALPPIDEKIGDTIYVESVELMQSNLQRSGAEYAILESFEFGRIG